MKSQKAKRTHLKNYKCHPSSNREMSRKWGLQFQLERIHTYHSIPNHYIMFLQIFFGKTKSSMKSNFAIKKGHLSTLQLKSTKKLTLLSRSSTLPPRKTGDNPTIRKHQEINPVTRKSNPNIMKNECHLYNQEAPRN